METKVGSSISFVILGLALILSGCQTFQDRYIPMISPTADVDFIILTAMSTPTYEGTIYALAPTLEPLAGEMGDTVRPLVPTSAETPTLDLAIAIPTYTLTASATHTSKPLLTPPPPLPSSTQGSPAPTKRPTSTPEPYARIAYVSAIDGNRELYLADWDIKGLVEVNRITDNPSEDTHPVLSPDGGTLAFVSDRSGNREIYLLDLRTGERKELTYRLADDSNPTWSPDGTHIAFQSDRDGIPEIYVIETACADQPNGCPNQVIRLTNNIADDLAPAWSPNGNLIAFMSSREGNLELYVMNVDGSKPSRLTFNSGVDGFPTWSPDGTMLAYHSERDGNFDIYMMTIDRQQEWRLTTYTFEEIAPEWCGESILFMAYTHGDYDIGLIPVSSEDPQSDPLIVGPLVTSAFEGFPSCVGTLIPDPFLDPQDLDFSGINQ